MLTKILIYSPVRENLFSYLDRELLALLKLDKATHNLLSRCPSWHYHLLRHEVLNAVNFNETKLFHAALRLILTKSRTHLLRTCPPHSLNMHLNRVESKRFEKFLRMIELYQEYLNLLVLIYKISGAKIGKVINDANVDELLALIDPATKKINDKLNAASLLFELDNDHIELLDALKMGVAIPINSVVKNKQFPSALVAVNQALHKSLMLMRYQIILSPSHCRQFVTSHRHDQKVILTQSKPNIFAIFITINAIITLGLVCKIAALFLRSPSGHLNQIGNAICLLGMSLAVNSIYNGCKLRISNHQLAESITHAERNQSSWTPLLFSAMTADRLKQTAHRFCEKIHLEEKSTDIKSAMMRLRPTYHQETQEENIKKIGSSSYT